MIAATAVGTAATSAVADPTEYSYQSAEPAGDFPGGLVVDTNAQRVYTIGNTNRSSDSTLTVLDEGTQQVVAQVSVAPDALSVAVDTERDLVYVSSASGIQIIDGSTDTVVGQISLTSGGPIAVDSTTHTIYEVETTTLRVIDGMADTVTATTSLGASSVGYAGGFVVNQTTHRVFIGERDSAVGTELAEYDGSTGALITSAQIPDGLVSLAVNETTNLVYIAGVDTCVLVFNPVTNTSQCGPLPGGPGSAPREVAVDSATNTLFILSDDNVSLLSIASATATQSTSVQNASGFAQGVAVDPTNGKLFVITSGNVGQGFITTYWTSALPTTDRLLGGAFLGAGGSLVAAANGFHLDMQSDGNLVVYNSAHVALWNSHTFVEGSYVDMQTDGNLVLHSGVNGAVLWNSRTSGAPGAYVKMQADGNLVVYQGTRALFNTLADQPPPASAIDVTPTADFTLNAGTELDPGQQLTHSSWRAAMQADGNFVVYHGTSAVWWTGTFVAGSLLRVQADGNMVIYAPAGYPEWSSNTSSPVPSSSKLVMQLDGNLVLYRSDGSAAWHRFHDTGSLIAPPPPPLAQYTLSAVGSMAAGDQLVYGNYRATMQADGNFVVYNGATALWSSRTSVAGSHLALQADGNLVIYGPAGNAVWTTYTTGVTRLVMQADGNLVAYRADGTAAWYRLHDTSARLSS